MPSANKRLLVLHGTDQYERYLGRLASAIRKSGVSLPEGHAALADYALVRLGMAYEMMAPRRAAPLGTNRHGEPKATA